MRVTLLGTGTSHGVPMIDCMLNGYVRCPQQVCLKAGGNPRHHRTRASILIEAGDSSLLVDTSQDFREQMLANQVKRIDAVLYTHAHADHIFGLPDIRSYCQRQGRSIPIYGTRPTLDSLERSFAYIFHPPAFAGGGIPSVTAHALEERTTVNGLEVHTVPVDHGNAEACVGYRIGNLAYLPDVKAIPESSLALLEGLDLLILNCLRPRPHVSHLSLTGSRAYVERLRPARCLFTHMTHDIDYELEERNLPDGVRFAYDGQIVYV